MITNQNYLTPEDFLIDSTFQQYCAGTDSLCTQYWEKYIQDHPSQLDNIQEAKRLYIVLSGNKQPLNVQVERFRQKNLEKASAKTVSLASKVAIAAAVVLILMGAWFFYANRFETPKSSNVLIAPATEKTFTTQGLQRQKLTLPDGSTVILNAKASLSVSRDFGSRFREVVLDGEAYFDIAHDNKKPFKVYTRDFVIKVTGTVFNVKAYKSDPASSETVLLQGSIIMQATNGKTAPISLVPSQKVIFYTPGENGDLLKASIDTSIGKIPEIILKHYTIVKDSTIVETAWTRNHIEIYDQSFADIKATFEKWYNVEIEFKDPEIEKYRFTATFINETIGEALNTLQKAKKFSYTIQGNKVIVFQ